MVKVGSLRKLIRNTLFLSLPLGLVLFSPPTETNLDIANLPIFENAQHFLGSDRLGRDNASLFVYGIFGSLVVCIPARLLTIALGALFAGFHFLLPRVFSFPIQSLASVFLALPSLLVALLVLAIFPENLFSVFVAIALADWAFVFESLQSKIAEVKDSGFVLASLSMGASGLHIFLFHILPSLYQMIQFLFITGIPSVVMTLALFSYLGVNLDFFGWGPSLGEQIAFSKDYMEKNPSSVLLPILGVTLTIYSLGYTKESSP